MIWRVDQRARVSSRYRSACSDPLSFSIFRRRPRCLCCCSKHTGARTTQPDLLATVCGRLSAMSPVHAVQQWPHSTNCERRALSSSPRNRGSARVHSHEPEPGASHGHPAKAIAPLMGGAVKNKSTGAKTTPGPLPAVSNMHHWAKKQGLAVSNMHHSVCTSPGVEYAPHICKPFPLSFREHPNRAQGAPVPQNRQRMAVILSAKHPVNTVAVGGKTIFTNIQTNKKVRKSACFGGR